MLRILLAAACVDESDHLALVNAGDEDTLLYDGRACGCKELGA